MSVEFFKYYGDDMLNQGMSLSYIAHYFGDNVYVWFNEYKVFNTNKEEK